MIRLAKLPDRGPVKLTVSLSPKLHRSLADYGRFYASIYGQDEAIGKLIPAIIGAFLEADRAFAKFRSTTTNQRGSER